MEFKEYLIKKKIDSDKFKTGEPAKYAEYHGVFMQMHPESFTSQKLYLINKLRRKYLLEEVEAEAEMKKTIAAKPRPVARPKPKS